MSQTGGRIAYPPERKRRGGGFGKPGDFGGFGGGRGRGPTVFIGDTRDRALALLHASLEDAGLTLSEDGRSYLHEAMGEQLAFLESHDVVADQEVETPYGGGASRLQTLERGLSGYEVTLFNIGRLSQVILDEARATGTTVVDRNLIQRIKDRICPLPPFC